MRNCNRLLRTAVLASTLFSASLAYSQWSDNQISDCASVTPKGGLALPQTKVGSSSKGELVVKNTSANKVVISGIDQDGGGFYEDFSVDLSQLPVTLKPGESHIFSCTYAPTAPVPWTGGSFAVFVLRFEGSDLDTSVCHYINFILSGDTLGTQSGVSMNDLSTIMTVYPNPTTDKIDVGVSSGYMQSIEVFDALGTVVTTSKNAVSWSWDLRSMSGSKVSAGIYFIRVRARNSTGEFITTRKVIIK